MAVMSDAVVGQPLAPNGFQYSDEPELDLNEAIAGPVLAQMATAIDFAPDVGVRLVLPVELVATA